MTSRLEVAGGIVARAQGASHRLRVLLSVYINDSFLLDTGSSLQSGAPSPTRKAAWATSHMEVLIEGWVEQ